MINVLAALPADGTSDDSVTVVSDRRWTRQKLLLTIWILSSVDHVGGGSAPRSKLDRSTLTYHCDANLGVYVYTART